MPWWGWLLTWVGVSPFVAVWTGRRLARNAVLDEAMTAIAEEHHRRRVRASN